MPESMIWPDTLKRTKPRQLVLEMLEQAGEPMTATEIAGRLDSGGTPVSLSTIYRVLDAFAGYGMVAKTAVLENGMAVYEASGRAHRHYAVCMRCHKIIPLRGCPLDRLAPQLEDADFHVTGHRLQMVGYCSGCVPK